jgi:DNA gyrase subunit A
VLLHTILSLDPDETVTAVVPVPDFDEVEYCTMVTRHGRIKRVEVSAFESVRPSGLIAISLDESDRLNWVKLTTGGQDLLLVTAGGQSIRFNENQVRAMGRGAQGVNAIRLRPDDEVAGVTVLTDPDLEVLVVTERGYGKVSPQDEYPRQSRFGLGVRTLARNQKTGPVIDARTVRLTDHVTLVTANGKALRTAVAEISRMGRNTQGVQLINLAEGDTVASIALHDEMRRLEREAALAAEGRELTDWAAAALAQRVAQRAALADDDEEYEDENGDDLLYDEDYEDEEPGR